MPSAPRRNDHNTARHLDARLRAIFDVIKQGRFPNNTTLSDKLEVSSRTIRVGRQSR